jgi:hypothetical protein
MTFAGLLADQGSQHGSRRISSTFLFGQKARKSSIQRAQAPQVDGLLDMP